MFFSTLLATTDVQFAQFCAAARCDHLVGHALGDAQLAAELTTVFAAQGASSRETQLVAAGVGCVRADSIEVDRFIAEDPRMVNNGWARMIDHPRFGRLRRWGPVVTWAGSTPSMVPRRWPTNLARIAASSHSALYDRAGAAYQSRAVPLSQVRTRAAVAKRTRGDGPILLVILDTGFLVAVDRGELRAKTFLERAGHERRTLHTTEAVIAQAWREGARQAMLARFLHGVTTHSLSNGRLVGELLAKAQTSDVVAAHLALTADKHGLNIVTGDPDDLTLLAGLLPSKPTIHAWTQSS